MTTSSDIAVFEQMWSVDWLYSTSTCGQRPCTPSRQ